jgi:hypothetical protein
MLGTADKETNKIQKRRSGVGTPAPLFSNRKRNFNRRFIV